jgi:hypothetical protein
MDLATAAASDGRPGCCIRSRAVKSGDGDTDGRACDGVDVGEVEGDETLVRGLYALRLASTLWNEGAPFSVPLSGGSEGWEGRRPWAVWPAAARLAARAGCRPWARKPAWASVRCCGGEAAAKKCLRAGWADIGPRPPRLGGRPPIFPWPADGSSGLPGPSNGFLTAEAAAAAAM